MDKPEQLIIYLDTYAFLLLICLFMVLLKSGVLLKKIKK